MKKVFSLLLVGVVTISMFSFITPNRVDATETKAKKETILFNNKGNTTATFLLRYYSQDDTHLTTPLNKSQTITVAPGESVCRNIKSSAYFVYVKAPLTNRNKLYREFLFCKSNCKDGTGESSKHSITVDANTKVIHKVQYFDYAQNSSNSFGLSRKTTTPTGT